MSALPASALTDLLGFEGRLAIGDIGAAYIAEPPPYKGLVDLGLAHLNAFDADVRQHAKLKAVYGEDLSLFTEILGDGSAQTLHLAAAGSGMTSLLRPSAPHLAFFNGFEGFGKILETREVATTRLDDIAGLPDLDFLKMDIQGSELAVLAHGTERLRRCAMIQLEVSFVPLYENQPTFGEIDVWMRAHGFIPHSFVEVKRWSISPVLRNNDVRMPFNQLLEADVVYVRDPVDPGKLDPQLARKMALLAHHCYRSVDLAGRLISHLQSIGEIGGDSFARYIELVNSR
jgi:FkbM family methyltransferase